MNKVWKLVTFAVYTGAGVYLATQPTEVPQLTGSIMLLLSIFPLFAILIDE